MIKRIKRRIEVKTKHQNYFRAIEMRKSIFFLNNAVSIERKFLYAGCFLSKSELSAKYSKSWT